MCSSFKLSNSSHIGTFQVTKNLESIASKGALTIPLITIQNDLTLGVEDSTYDFQVVN